jgi:hypothetical protein
LKDRSQKPAPAGGKTSIDTPQPSKPLEKRTIDSLPNLIKTVRRNERVIAWQRLSFK